MSNSIAGPLSRTQPNDLRSRLDGIRTKNIKVRIDPNPTDQKEILAVIRSTMSEVGLSQKAMALTARCSESELSDALNNRENRRFDAEWLWRQDDLFLVAFWEQVKAKRQLTEENEKAARRKRILELIDLLLAA